MLDPGSSPADDGGAAWPVPPRGSGRNAGSRTVPLACSRACFRTLCSSRMLPGQE